MKGKATIGFAAGAVIGSISASLLTLHHGVVIGIIGGTLIGAVCGLLIKTFGAKSGG